MRAIARSLLLLLLAASSLALAFVAGIIAAPAADRWLRPAALAQTKLASSRTEQDLALLLEAWRIIERDYYGKPLDQQALVHGTIDGLVNALADPYSVYVGAADVASSEREIAGSLHSLGVAIEKRDDALIVIAPLASSPAQRAGVRAGDRISRIDGQDTAALTLGEAASLLRGPAGSRTTLTIRRADLAPITLTIEREAAAVPLLQARYIAPGIAYVNIAAFGPAAPRDLAAFLQQPESAGLQSIILDLRNNPGGYLDAAVEVAGQFIAEGLIVTQFGRHGATAWAYRDGGKTLVVSGPDGVKTLTVRFAPRALLLPIAVLTNRGTASAAEVLAAALREHGRAILIGEGTFGKGAVSGDYTLSDGSTLHLTNGYWLPPKGRSIDGQGLAPDIGVGDADDTDALIKLAIDYLSTKH